ncbi:MAG TPA: DUF58 domain-containing protein [Trebonia sp.]|nr:DUF58 domain-containing protein [Trebonia sp.]
MRWTLSRHARRLLTLAAAAVVIAVITRRVEFAGLAAPALLLLGAGRPSRPAKLAVRMRPTTTRLHEDEPAAIDVALDTWVSPGPDGARAGAEAGADGRGAHEVRWILHPGHGVDADGATSVIGDAARFTFTVPRWGKRPVGSVEAVLHDRWRLTEGHFTLPLPSIDVYPHPAVQRTRVVLSRLPNRLGEHSARVPGEGTEFTGVREYVPGDRQRQINWPASTRRGRLQVNTFAAERSQDVVLLVDATSDVGEPGSSALDLALRGASGAARAYLDARDRVGVITYQWGGARWLAPGLGRRQVYRIIDAMLAADASWSRGAVLHRLPRAALPPGALVVVFSPLLDQRFVEALRDMRERGFALMVMDVLNVDPPASRFSFVDDIAARIWRMEQQAIRFSLRELGIPVVHWDGVSPLDLPLAPYTRRPVVVRR